MRIVSALTRRVIVFIVARPKLSFFMRRLIGRFPAIANRLRGTVARARHPGWQPPAAVVLSGDGQLSDAARDVLQDLRRLVKNSKNR